MEWIAAAALLLLGALGFVTFALWRQRQRGVAGDGEVWIALLRAAGLTAPPGATGLCDAQGERGGMRIEASASRNVPGHGEPPEVDVAVAWTLPRWGALPLQVRTITGGQVDLAQPTTSGNAELDAHYRFAGPEREWLDAVLARPDVRDPLLGLIGVGQVRLDPGELSVWIPPVPSTRFRGWTPGASPLDAALEHGTRLAVAMLANTNPGDLD